MDYEQMADALALCGNSLLAPITQTANVGLDPAFWEAFPTFGDEGVARAAQSCAMWAAAFGRRCESADQDVVTRCAVEYTRLFVGPPRPAAAPWETAYRAAAAGVETSVGFGQATFEMRELLREAGLGLSNENHQYEDHMGIELLLASELCRRAGEGEDWGADAGCVPSAASEGADADTQNALSAAQHAVDFVRTRPLSWMSALREAVERESPNGFYASLLQLTQALLELVA